MNETRDHEPLRQQSVQLGHCWCCVRPRGLHSDAGHRGQAEESTRTCINLMVCIRRLLARPGHTAGSPSSCAMFMKAEKSNPAQKCFPSPHSTITCTSTSLDVYMPVGWQERRSLCCGAQMNCSMLHPRSERCVSTREHIGKLETCTLTEGSASSSFTAFITSDSIFMFTALNSLGRFNPIQHTPSPRL